MWNWLLLPYDEKRFTWLHDRRARADFAYPPTRDRREAFPGHPSDPKSNTLTWCSGHRNLARFGASGMPATDGSSRFRLVYS